jgi:hypothetical protein
VVLWVFLLILRLQGWFGTWRHRLSSAAIRLEGVLIHAAPFVMLAISAGLALRLLLVGPW